MLTRILKHAILASVIGLMVAGCSTKPKVNTMDSGAFSDPNMANYAPGSYQEFTHKVGDKVFFTTGSSVLTPQSRGTLDRQVGWLNRYRNYQINIEGHADERGTREYNLALGQRRAVAVKNYLASRGLPSNRIRTISYGKERPVEACNSQVCWDKNRRAVTGLIGG